MSGNKFFTKSLACYDGTFNSMGFFFCPFPNVLHNSLFDQFFHPVKEREVDFLFEIRSHVSTSNSHRWNVNV